MSPEYEPIEDSRDLDARTARLEAVLALVRTSIQELLEQRIDLKIDGLRTEIKIRMDGADRAVETASEAMTIRLTHANGLLEKMSQDKADFARKEDIGAIENTLTVMRESVTQSLTLLKDSMVSRIAALEQERSRHEGRAAGIQPMVAIGMAVIVAIIMAGISFVTARIGAAQ